MPKASFSQYEKDFITYDPSSKKYITYLKQINKPLTKNQLDKLIKEKYTFTQITGNKIFSEENFDLLNMDILKKIYFAINNVTTLDTENFVVDGGFKYFLEQKISCNIKKSPYKSIYISENEFDNIVSNLIKTEFKKHNELAKKIYEDLKISFFIKHNSINHFFTIKKYYDIEFWLIKFFQRDIDDLDFDSTCDFSNRLNEEQKIAVKYILNNSITFLSGGAGTGKSSVAKDVVYNLLTKKKIDKTDIYAIAPTGCAVNVLKNKLHSLIPICNIATIHRWFYTCKKKPKYIIVDETSMLSIDHMELFFNKKDLLQDTNFLFLGDLNQLPPISCCYFMQIMSNLYNFKLIELIEIKRQQGGKLLELSKALLENKEFDYNTLLDDNTINFIPADIYEAPLSQTYQNIMIDLNFKDTEENMFIFPEKKDRECINHKYQQLLNGDADTLYKNKNDIIFKINDRVMRTKNNAVKDGKVVVNLFANGDFGYLRKKKSNHKIIYYIGYDSHDTEILESLETLDEFNLGYGRTIHNSQGDEADNIILYCQKEQSMVTTNLFRHNLIYTALTRAKEKLFIVGDLEVFINCCKHITNVKSIYTHIEE